MITGFHNIEITSRCNLRCHYCPQPKMARAKIDMTEETFDRVVYWVGEFNQQPAIHLHNFGESTLHPQLGEWISRLRPYVPQVLLSSNGVGVTREKVQELKDAGLSVLSLSVHRPEVIQWVVAYCKEVGLPYDIAGGPVQGTHNWADQVNAPMTLEKRFDCHFLRYQRCTVLADGRIAACCIDAEGTSVIHEPMSELGEVSVYDDLRKYSFKPFKLCLTCHHDVPNELFPGWRDKLMKESAGEPNS